MAKNASIEDRRAIAKEIVDKTLHAVHKIFGSDNPSRLISVFDKNEAEYIVFCK